MSIIRIMGLDFLAVPSCLRACLTEFTWPQMYRGRLQNGSLVAIRRLNLKRGHNSQNFNHQIELISKLRHRYLVSALGHCFEYYVDDSSISRLFFIFEYMMNGTLRSNISGMWED